MEQDEISLNKLGEQAELLIGGPPSDGAKPWGTNLPEKRVTLSREQMNLMENTLASKIGEDEQLVGEESTPTEPKAAPLTAGGYKFDAGKPRWDLAPFDAFEAMVKIQTWAINKEIRGDRAYPERNWERGMKWSRVFGAMIRHAWKWWMGKMTGGSTVDEESGMSHAWHFFTCAGFLVAYEIRQMNEFDDRPSTGT